MELTTEQLIRFYGEKPRLQESKRYEKQRNDLCHNFIQPWDYALPFQQWNWSLGFSANGAYPD